MASRTVPTDLPLDVLADHVVRTPGVCGGRPRIKGTRITVWHIGRWYHEERRTVEEIVTKWPTVSKADVFAALAYASDNWDALEAEQAAAEARVLSAGA